ncbi:MAG: hypothetical protein NC827_00580 [Candidatus Omnitrophica bacterium]|nr:hypothetical protein [Candidatus Omnitrophota bacterium]MCM8801797.1 hypothetical protein [Candidatus Omnitrophota bacterium]
MIFVIQEHFKTSHHFDLCLEINGVLKLWEIPKGKKLKVNMFYSILKKEKIKICD